VLALSTSLSEDIPYLIPQTSLLYDIHADVENIVHQLLALACRVLYRFLALLLLVLARPNDRVSQNIQVPRLDGNPNNLLVVPALIAALEDAHYRTLEVLLYVPLQHHRRRMRTRHARIPAAGNCRVK
jgi:hypothetical protein